MKKLLLLLSLILVSCSGGISEKSLFGEWVSQEGKITINEDNMNIDGSQYKYSINDINQDLGIIKLTILGSDAESFDADFVIKDEDNIQMTDEYFYSENFSRYDLSKLSIFDEVPESITEYWANSSDMNLIDLNYAFYQPYSGFLTNENDEFVDNFKKENPAFNLNSTYLDVLKIFETNFSLEELKKEDAELAALILFWNSLFDE
jgi:hypothetical protein